MGPASALAIFFGIVVVMTIVDVVQKLAAQAAEEARRRQLEEQGRQGQEGRAPAQPPKDDLEAFLRRLVDAGEAAAAPAPPPVQPPPKRVVLRAKPVEPARPAKKPVNRVARSELEDRHLVAAVEQRHLEGQVERRHLQPRVEDRHLETHVGDATDGVVPPPAAAPALRARPTASAGAPLQRLERLPLPARSLVLAELFGQPPGLRGPRPGRQPPPRPRPPTAKTLDAP